MTPAQMQTLLQDAQLAITALAPFATLLGPGAGLAVGLATASVNAIETAVNNGTDVTDAQLAVIKGGAAASLQDGLAAEANAAAVASGTVTTGTSQTAGSGATPLGATSGPSA